MRQIVAWARRLLASGGWVLLGMALPQVWMYAAHQQASRVSWVAFALLYGAFIATLLTGAWIARPAAPGHRERTALNHGVVAPIPRGHDGAGPAGTEQAGTESIGANAGDATSVDETPCNGVRPDCSPLDATVVGWVAACCMAIFSACRILEPAAIGASGPAQALILICAAFGGAGAAVWFLRWFTVVCRVGLHDGVGYLLLGFAAAAGFSTIVSVCAAASGVLVAVLLGIGALACPPLARAASTRLDGEKIVHNTSTDDRGSRMSAFDEDFLQTDSNLAHTEASSPGVAPSTVAYAVAGTHEQEKAASPSAALTGIPTTKPRADASEKPSTHLLGSLPAPLGRHLPLVVGELVLFSFVLGLLQGMGPEAQGDSLATWTALALRIVMPLLLFVWVGWRGGKGGLVNVSQVMLIVIAVVFVGLALAGPAAGAWLPILASVARNFVLVLLTVVLLYIAHTGAAHPHLVYGVGRGIHALGTLAGVLAHFQMGQGGLPLVLSLNVALFAIAVTFLALGAGSTQAVRLLEEDAARKAGRAGAGEDPTSPAPGVHAAGPDAALRAFSATASSADAPAGAAQPFSAVAWQAGAPAVVQAPTPDQLVSATMDALDARCDELAAGSGLTERETAIVKLLAKGRSRGFIATELVISENTVRFHCRNAYAKLGIHTKQELLSLIGVE